MTLPKEIRAVMVAAATLPPERFIHGPRVQRGLRAGGEDQYHGKTRVNRGGPLGGGILKQRSGDYVVGRIRAAGSSLSG